MKLVTGILAASITTLEIKLVCFIHINNVNVLHLSKISKCYRQQAPKQGVIDPIIIVSRRILKLEIHNSPLSKSWACYREQALMQGVINPIIFRSGF